MYYIATTHRHLTAAQLDAAEAALRAAGAYLDGFARRAGHTQPQWTITTAVPVSREREAELVAVAEQATGMEWV